MLRGPKQVLNMVLEQSRKPLITKPILLNEMIEVIVEVAAPERIILFGSQARGTARPHSDYDFLIVDSQTFGKNHSRRQLAGKIWRSLRPFDVSVDLLLYNKEEVDYLSQSLNHVVSCALREGKVMYERSYSS